MNWLSFMAALLIMMTGCAQDENFDQMFQRLTDGAVTVVKPLEAMEMSNALFLDAREPREYEVSHIEGARCVGYDEFDLDSISDLDKSQPIVGLLFSWLPK